MLLSYTELMELVEQGVITADPSLVNGASIDVRLDDTVMVENVSHGVERIIDLSQKEELSMILTTIPENGLVFKPNQFILASTVEEFNLPNDIACEFKLKSSIARAGLNHLLAGYADPGWHNSKLTLELKNNCEYHSLLLKAGMKIGQMIFYRVKPVPEQHSYAVKGRYNNTTEVTGSKGV